LRNNIESLHDLPSSKSIISQIPIIGPIASELAETAGKGWRALTGTQRLEDRGKPLINTKKLIATGYNAYSQYNQMKNPNKKPGVI